MSGVRGIQQAIGRSKDAELLKQTIDERAQLVGRLNEINLLLSQFHSAKDPKRLELIKEKDQLVLKIQSLKSSTKVHGSKINDVFRSVVTETLPQQVFHRIMDEVEFRMKGRDPEKISLLSDKQLEQLESVTKTNDELVALKYRVMQLKNAINEVMPDLGKSGSAEYQHNVKLYKILSKLNSIINQPL